MTLRHKRTKWFKGMKDSGRTMWDEEAENGVMRMAKRSEELRTGISGKATGEDEELESSGDEGEDNLFDEDQQQAKQRLLAELEKLENENDSAKGQHNKSKLMGLKFMQNAEGAWKKANKTQVDGLRRALEDDDRSDKTGKDEEEEGNASGRMILGTGRKNKEKVKNLVPAKSEFEEAERSSEDGYSEDSLGEDEVTIVNKPSSNTLNSKVPKDRKQAVVIPCIHLFIRQWGEGTSTYRHRMRY